MNINSTIEEAKIYISENVDVGVKCPCCEQFAKVYKRKITSIMVRGLIVLYRYDIKNQNKFMHKDEIGKYLNDKVKFGGGDFAKLSYWGMIEGRDKEDGQKGKTSGYWRITSEGRDFIEGKSPVPKHKYVYDSKVLPRESGEYVTVREALSEKFDYAELMGFTSNQ